jgi:hypothetical protein
MPFILLPGSSSPEQVLQWSNETGVLVNKLFALNKELKRLHDEALKQPQRPRSDSAVGDTPKAGEIQNAQAELDATFDELKKYYPPKGGRRRSRSRRTRRHH